MTSTPKTGAAIVFFTYIGFDSVSTAAEECRRPPPVRRSRDAAWHVNHACSYVLTPHGVDPYLHWH